MTFFVKSPAYNEKSRKAAIFSKSRKGESRMYSLTGARLRSLRETGGYTQVQIASLIDCSQVSYCHYETGRRTLPEKYLVQLAVFYGVSTDYLLGLTDEKTPYSRREVTILR